MPLFVLCADPGVQVQCEECVSAVADLRCLQCHGDFCTQCSAIVHSSSRALRSHHPLPINQALSAPQLCPNHPQQPKLHYCKEENEIICTECILNGIHKDHEVVTISHAVSHKGCTTLAYVRKGRFGGLEVERYFN